MKKSFIIVTWPTNTTATTTPEDVIVVENCELTGLCNSLEPGGRTVALAETTLGVTELETTTLMETTTNEQDTTTQELDNIPTPARIFV